MKVVDSVNNPVLMSVDENTKDFISEYNKDLDEKIIALEILSWFGCVFTRTMDTENERCDECNICIASENKEKIEILANKKLKLED